jgi:hypothetical protein
MDGAHKPAVPAGFGYQTWGPLILNNFDYVVDGLVLQLQQPELFPNAAPLLSALFQHAPVTPELLPALTEPTMLAIQNLSILSRHQRPQHTRSFLAAVRPVVAAAAAQGQALVAESTELACRVRSRIEAQQEELFLELQALDAAGEDQAHCAASAKGAAPDVAGYFEEYHGRREGHAEDSGCERRERSSRVELSTDDRQTLHARIARVAASSELAAAACRAAAPLLLSESLPTSVAAHALVKVPSLLLYLC